MNNSLYNLIAVQFKEFFREPAIIFWALIFPLAIAGVLGIAFTKQEEPVRKIAIIENSLASGSSNLAKLIERNSQATVNDLPSFEFINMTAEEAALKLKRGEINVFIEVAEQDRLNFNFDPLNAEGRLVYLMLENNFLQQDRIHALAVKPITTQGNRYIDFLIPGLIALGIMNSCIWGIGWNLIEGRIKKLMRRMVATPMRKSYFLLGHIISRAVLAALEAALLLIFAYYVFDINIQGSYLAFAVVFFTGVMAFAGIAVFASSRATTTTEGNGIINAIVLPMTILSGIFFSYRSFPDWAITIIEKLPLTMLADALREIFNEGATLANVGGYIAGMAITGLVFFVAGLRIYKWY